MPKPTIVVRPLVRLSWHGLSTVHRADPDSARVTGLFSPVSAAALQQGLDIDRKECLASSPVHTRAPAAAAGRSRAGRSRHLGRGQDLDMASLGRLTPRGPRAPCLAPACIRTRRRASLGAGPASAPGHRAILPVRAHLRMIRALRVTGSSPAVPASLEQGGPIEARPPAGQSIHCTCVCVRSSAGETPSIAAGARASKLPLPVRPVRACGEWSGPRRRNARHGLPRPLGGRLGGGACFFLPSVSASESKQKE